MADNKSSFMTNFLSGLGGGAAGVIGSAASGLLGMIGAGKRQKKAMEMQKQLMQETAKLNYEYGEMAADNAFDRQMQMYERTYQDNSPENKVKQMEDAGLSVGLMYSGSAQGAGGAGQASTAPQGGGAGNQQAARAAEFLAVENQRRIADLQAAKIASEIKVNQSIADKNKAEAEYTGGAKTQETLANIGKLTVTIDNIVQSTGNMKVQKAGIELVNRINRVKAEINEATKDLQIDKIEFEVEKIDKEVDYICAKIDNTDVDTDTKKGQKDSIIEQAKLQVANIAADTAVKWTQISLMGSQQRLTERQIKEIGQKIELRALEGKTEVEWLRLELEKMGLKMKSENLDRTVSIINSIMGIIGGVGTAAVPRTSTTTSTVRTGRAK